MARQPQTKVMGRRPTTKEKKTERLPPIYVTPSFKAELDNKQAQSGMDWAEFGRTALEDYVGWEGGEASAESTEPPANQITLDLDPELFEQLIELAGTFGIEDLSSFVKHIAKRTAQLPDDTFTAFVAGKLETVVDPDRAAEDALVEDDRRKQRETRQSQAERKLAAKSNAA